jgi:hypothetical protein
MLRPAPRVAFFCAAKRKRRKKRPPRRRRPCGLPCASRRRRGTPDRTSMSCWRVRAPGAPRQPRGLLRLRLRCSAASTGCERHPCQLCASRHRPWQFSPRMARPSTARLCPQARRGAGGNPRLARGIGRCRRASLKAKPRSAGKAHHPGRVSLGDFSLHEQREVTLGRGRSTPDPNTPPKAAQAVDSTVGQPPKSTRPKAARSTAPPRRNPPAASARRAAA